MGDIADDILDGLFCQVCGAIMDDIAASRGKMDAPGYPRTCKACLADEARDKAREGDNMDKCPKCGSKFEVEAKSTADIPAFQAFVCDTCVYADGSTFEGTECLRRQLAAANERAGRLEAQMAELREAWADYAPDALDGRLISLHGVTAHRSWPKLNSILGGA